MPEAPNPWKRKRPSFGAKRWLILTGSAVTAGRYSAGALWRLTHHDGSYLEAPVLLDFVAFVGLVALITGVLYPKENE